MVRITLTIKDLHRIIYLHRQIERDCEQLYALRDMAEGTSSKPTDNLRVQTSLPTGGNKFADAAADLGEIIEEEVQELTQLKAKVRKFVDNLDVSVDTRIIEMRYISCYDWQEIAELLGYAERHIFRIHNKLIADLPKE